MTWSVLPNAYRLDLLLKPDTHPRTGKPRAGFETVGQCQAEDLSRALALRATAQAIIASGKATVPADLASLNLDLGTALNLADRLQAGAESGCSYPTLASALFMREQRLRFAAGLLELIDNNPAMEIKVVTAIHPSLGVRAEQLLIVDARKVRNQFRTHLNRSGVSGADGLFVGNLHGEFEPFSKVFQLHFHGVCAGEKLTAFERLRNKQGYVRTPIIYRPIVVNRILDPARQLSYVMQSFWSKKARVPVDDGEFYIRERGKNRIPEPYHSLYLIWLDQWRLSDLRLLNGGRMQGGKLVLS